MHGWYAAARVAGTKGLEGKLRLTNASAFLRSASCGDRAALVPPSEDEERFVVIEAIEESTEDSCLATFGGIAHADSAQRLVGRMVLLEGEKPEDASDEGLGRLEGFVVEDAVLGTVGVVDRIDDGPHRFQPLLHVKRGKEDAPALIPFVADLVLAIDEEGKRIIMKLPSGILDI